MKPQLNEIALYFITDSKLTKKTILDDVKAAIKAGTKIIQYREKEKSTKEMLKEAAKIKELCKLSNPKDSKGLEMSEKRSFSEHTPKSSISDESKTFQKDKAIFLINDRIDIALAVDADGVHLGNDDMPYETARQLLGKDKIIGLTIHNVKEAKAAEQLGADYIGVSPIFETKTKLDAGPASGIKLIEDVKKAVTIPFVAIGGINLENIGQVIKAGATSAAVISAIITKDDVEAECKKFINKLKAK